MNAIFILIPVGLIFLAAAIAALVWALNNGQYDDLDSPAVRILSDDEEPAPPADAGKTRPN